MNEINEEERRFHPYVRNETKESESQPSTSMPFNGGEVSPEKRFMLDENRHVVLKFFKGRLWLHIRDFFKKPTSSNGGRDTPDSDKAVYIPSKSRGIALTPDHWNALMSLHVDISREMQHMLEEAADI